ADAEGDDRLPGRLERLCPGVQCHRGRRLNLACTRTRDQTAFGADAHRSGDVEDDEPFRTVRSLGGDLFVLLFAVDRAADWRLLGNPPPTRIGLCRRDQHIGGFLAVFVANLDSCTEADDAVT